MSEESSADRTRQLLSARPSKVKFRKEVTDDAPEAFAYTSGVDSGPDVWLITSIFVLVVPVAFLTWAVTTGVIDPVYIR